jgi:hypothetical protein
MLNYSKTFNTHTLLKYSLQKNSILFLFILCRNYNSLHYNTIEIITLIINNIIYI